MGKDFIFPDLGEGIAEGELVKWLVKPGDTVKEDQEVAEVETDKALVTIPSPMAGVVEKLNYQEGDAVKVGSVLMTFKDAGGSEEKAPAQKTPPAQKKQAPPEQAPTEKKSAETLPLPPPAKSKLPPLATPYTRKIAREMGVDLNLVTGSGPEGRITEEDVRRFSESGRAVSTPTPLHVGEEKAKGPTLTPTAESFKKFGAVETVTIRGIRKKISETMLASSHQMVMVTHIDEAEVDKLIQLRNEKAEFAKERGVKLTLLPFLMKACVIALKDYPYLNASLIGEEIILKKYYHFGFAVDTDAGLMVPVIRDVDKKSIMLLATELVKLSTQARERSIDLEALHGHSFSITNIGSIGGKAFTPVIHYPDSAIMGLGRTYERPTVRGGEIVAASVLPLCLTFDHRITDGATAARFVNQVIQYLQDPDLLLLDDGES